MHEPERWEALRDRGRTIVLGPTVCMLSGVAVLARMAIRISKSSEPPACRPRRPGLRLRLWHHSRTHRTHVAAAAQNVRGTNGAGACWQVLVICSACKNLRWLLLDIRYVDQPLGGLDAY